ncbi:hypothetical protein LAX80_013980 (plasmid) [Listeria marthii]|nr:hypothetical protein LAX80_013980 [Listeria marthii]
MEWFFLENFKTIVQKIYRNEMELNPREESRRFYILVGYELTKGLLKVIERNPHQNASILSILDYYRMDTQELHDFVKLNSAEIPEFFSSEVLSFETFKDVQDYNFGLFLEVYMEQ